MGFKEDDTYYLNHLLRILKFDIFNSLFYSSYLESLEGNTFRFKSMADCSKEEVVVDDEKVEIPKEGFEFLYYKNNGEYFENITLTLQQYLRLEIEIKKRKLYTKLNTEKRTEKISATDISNFIFCPVNYAISKSFKYKILDEAKNGSDLHEKSLLKKRLDKSLKTYSSTEIEYNPLEKNKRFNELKEIIKDCEILYCDDSKSKVFKSKKGSFIGKPDYILINNSTKKIFIIEEKYQYSIDGNGDSKFYKNHIYQTLSYIYGIKDYEISFGILVYWKYEIINKGEMFIKDCYFKKVLPTTNMQVKLNETYLAIKNFNKNQNLDFTTSIRNPKKCASCVNNMLCGHKTGRFTKITLPYSENFLKLNQVRNANYQETKFSDQESKNKVLWYNVLMAENKFGPFEDDLDDDDIYIKEMPGA